jgi:hypothetical protein
MADDITQNTIASATTAQTGVDERGTGKKKIPGHIVVAQSY